MLNVIVLSVIILNVVMLRGVAPGENGDNFLIVQFLLFKMEVIGSETFP
jgi:hypothetical protein